MDFLSPRTEVPGISNTRLEADLYLAMGHAVEMELEPGSIFIVPVYFSSDSTYVYICINLRKMQLDHSVNSRLFEQDFKRCTGRSVYDGMQLFLRPWDVLNYLTDPDATMHDEQFNLGLS